MEIEIRALTMEVRNLVAVLERAERTKTIDRITDRGDKKDLFAEAWEEAKPLIHKNFESWRDYLYKYTLVVLSILGFLSTLIATKWMGELNIPLVVTSIVLMGLSIVVSFLTIFLTLYMERKFAAANMSFSQSMAVGFGKERDGDKNPMRCIEKYLAELIEQREKALEVLKKRRSVQGLSALDIEKLDWEIADLETGIKADKRDRSLMKYVGVQYTSYETLRLIITIVIVALSTSGIGTIIYALLSSYATAATAGLR